jgi:hypothetical protein
VGIHQIHKYSGIVMEKEDNKLKLVFCKTTRNIVWTEPKFPMLERNIDTTMSKLIDKGWKIYERFNSVEVP